MIDDDLGSNLEAPAPKVQKSKVASIGMPQTVKIMVEENDSIPPTGLFVGLNGKGFLIRPGEIVDVPQGVVDILDQAVESHPVMDPMSKRPTGYRERSRYPYRRVA